MLINCPFNEQTDQQIKEQIIINHDIEALEKSSKPKCIFVGLVGFGILFWILSLFIKEEEKCFKLKQNQNFLVPNLTYFILIIGFIVIRLLSSLNAWNFWGIMEHIF